MPEKKIIELNILRIISCLIVVVLIHIPNNYAYNFYVEMDYYSGFVLHTFGIFAAMGSFVFLSGFTLTMKMDSHKDSQVGNSPPGIIHFLKGRLIRVFPLYWIAIVAFLFIYGYDNYGFSFTLAHIFGMQILMAPIMGSPILTLWFIGILMLYYLSFLLFRWLKSLKKIIPAAIILLALFVLLRIYVDLIEYRFFLYYSLFIVGIIAAKIYNSKLYNRIHSSLRNTGKFLLPVTTGCIATLSLILYLSLTKFCYTTYRVQYNPMSFYSLLQNFGNYPFGPDLVAASKVLLLVDCAIICFIATVISISSLFGQLLKIIFQESRVENFFSLLAYPTYCVYLFHRPLIIILSAGVTRLFNIDMYAREYFYIALLFVVAIFLISFGIQKVYDSLLVWARKRQKMIKNDRKNKKISLEKEKVLVVHIDD